MNLVEAVEKTLSLALNLSSSINQSLLWDKRNLGKNIKEPYTHLIVLRNLLVNEPAVESVMRWVHLMIVDPLAGMKW